jgi:predicted transcriptional regulator
MVKVTFTLDDETVARLRLTAERLGKPQSLVVREAVAEYAASVGRLSDAERRGMLQTIDALAQSASTRDVRAVRSELTALRRARRAGGRRTPAPSR